MRKDFVLLLLQCFIFYVLCDGTYECGDHGRFEYCIDEIPGCVIGCHCHPGYYFDTDTKICEPNSKLIEHHGRRYVAEPSRVQNLIMTPNSIFETNPTTTTPKIDDAVDEISNNADDIGDWLYNQFFKTIENQVINNTDDKNSFTRRTGTGQLIKKQKKRKKSRKGTKSKQKVKKGHLKKRLLRITENDSVFDLSSGSSSDSSDSVSGSSDSSVEYDRYYKHHSDDDEHGHKKIVMIKKKPKQQLPSFIFLPNLETPFYPPLGLPSPPIPVPMYPIVPVPPVVPFCHSADCDNNDKTTVVPNKTTTIPTTLISTTTPINEEISNEPTHTEATTESADRIPDLLRHRSKKRNKELKTPINVNPANDLRFMSPGRQKLLQRLKQKIKNKSVKSLVPPWNRNTNVISNTPIKQDDLDSPYFENTLPDDFYMNNDIKPKIKEEDSAIPDNVDFKYITELIHRVDLNNKSNNLPPIEYNPLDSIEIYQPAKVQGKHLDYIVPPNVPDSRRLNRPNYQPSDESYYTNLGRQIASMIRGIDTQNREVNIKLEATHDIPKNDIYFNTNSPRSYWERSVRSPLTFLKANKKKFEYMKRSNELLFDIENKVEIIASTAPTLTLRELENIVNVIETAKREMQNKETIIKKLLPPENNLNVNLWPQELLNSRKLNRNIVPIVLKDNKKEPNRKTVTINNKNEINDNLHDFRMVSINKFAARQNPDTNQTSNFNAQISEIQSIIKPSRYVSENSVNYYQVPQHVIFNQNYPRTTFSQQNSKQPLWEHEMNPLLLKHRKYFDNSNNYFINQNGNLPYLESRPKGVGTSYFQHEINSFDDIM